MQCVEIAEVDQALEHRNREIRKVKVDEIALRGYEGALMSVHWDCGAEGKAYRAGWWRRALMCRTYLIEAIDAELILLGREARPHLRFVMIKKPCVVAADLHVGRPASTAAVDLESAQRAPRCIFGWPIGAYRPQVDRLTRRRPEGVDGAGRRRRELHDNVVVILELKLREGIFADWLIEALPEPSCQRRVSEQKGCDGRARGC